VTVHDGCARAKLSAMMLVVDVAKFKAVVQFRQETTMSVCRYCKSPLSESSAVSASASLHGICGSEECQEKANLSCGLTHTCGHQCGGVRDESECLPCLHHCASEDELKVKLTQECDDMCMICWSDTLAEAPSIQLKCGHVFHYKCVLKMFESRWPGPRITFAFTQCPCCRQTMSHRLIKDVADPIQALFDEVKTKALQRIEYMGMSQVDDVVKAGGKFYNDLPGYAMDRLAYYMCFKCKHPYFGGERQCAAAAPEKFDPSELVCGGCSSSFAEQNCPKHGKDYLEFKCRYCCSVAVWFCFGTTHFCDPCHSDYSRVTGMAKADLPQCPVGPRATQIAGDECPLGLVHPPTGEEFALGCGICRNAKTF